MADQPQAEAPIDYKQVKEAMRAAGYAVTDGDAWTGVEAGLYWQFCRDASYNAGVPDNEYKDNYGFAYPSEMPAAIQNAVEGDLPWSGTLDGVPTSGQAPLDVVFTVTETGPKGTKYVFDFGDGSAKATETTPTANHTYTTAGSYTATCVVTVNGADKPPISAPAITVTPAYSATVAGTPNPSTVGVDVAFTVTEQNGNAQSFKVNFGDGPDVTETSPTFTHKYVTAGTYTVNVTPVLDGVDQTPSQTTQTVNQGA